MSEITTDQHWIQTPDGTLFARQWQPLRQTGAPIILLHDSLGCVALWRTFPQQLAATSGRCVIAYDRRGFGQSSPRTGSLPADFVEIEARADFETVRQYFGASRFVVLGHSVGGAMAICCAANSPDTCDGLITIAAQAYVDAQVLAGIRAAERQFAEPGQMQRLEKYHGHKADWVLCAWVDTWCSQAFSTWNLDPWLPRVTSAFLCLHGEHDEYGSPDHPRHLTRLAGGQTSLELISDCGHLPHRERPGIVLERVRSFLTRRVCVKSE